MCFHVSKIMGMVWNPVTTNMHLASVLLIGSLIGLKSGLASGFPKAKISNGQIVANMYLPDSMHGYYRSTRFDWSGAIYSLRYKGHDYYGPWFDSVDPKVINWVHRNGQIVDGPCGALEGPVDEFQIPLGWDDAKPGGTFIKIGVGVLRKTDGKYNRYFPYEVVNSGKWKVKRHKDSVEFSQELSDPDSGYGYIYRKVVRLVKGQPEMVIERSLRDTGRKEIKSQVYDHNFLTLDKQAPGPDFKIKLPFSIQTPRQPDNALLRVKGNEILYAKELSGEDEASLFIRGFGNSAGDSQIVIENSKVGAGLKIRGDRPLIMEALWSIRTVLAIEPYISIDVQPGTEFTWSNTFDYYTMPAK